MNRDRTGPVLVETKMQIPATRGSLVVRPRLLLELDRGRHARLVLISAPAGFGKTTLLADWLERSASDSAIAWLSLDAGDDRPTTFWTYVMTALVRQAPTLDHVTRHLMAQFPVPVERLLTAVINEITLADQDLWLALDDYHAIVDPEIRAGITFLVSHLPPRMHLAITTRADPTMPLSKWRARGELVEIRSAALRFTPDEAGAYLAHLPGPTLTAAQVLALEHRTEGWIAAIQLAGLSLPDQQDIDGFIARLSGTDRFVVDYLVDEVLAQQDDEVREFLLLTSVLDRLSGGLCDALTAREDGVRTLLSLERANLFLIPLDEKRTWFRYHHLFADVLRAQLRSEQPIRVAELHLQASLWFQGQGLIAEAINHALAAEQNDRAAALIESAIPAARQSRQDALLVGWLTSLPQQIISSHPILSVFYGWTLMMSGDPDGAGDRLDDADRALDLQAVSSRSREDRAQIQALPATIEVYRAGLAQARGDVGETLAHARQALELAPSQDHLSRGAAYGFLGLAAWADGDIVPALDTFGRATASLRRAGNLVDELGGTVVLAQMWLTAGRPSRARRLYRRALERADRQKLSNQLPVAVLRTGLSEIDCEAGNLASAMRLLESAQDLREQTSVIENRYRWHLAMAKICRARNDLAAAHRQLDLATLAYVPGFFPDVQPIPAIRARLHIAGGELDAAQNWARDSLNPTGLDMRFLDEFNRLTWIRLLLAQHRLQSRPAAMEEGLSLLDRLESSAETSARAGSLVEIRMLQALTLDSLGHRKRAVITLNAALNLSPEPESYQQLFLDEGPRLLELLAAGVESEPDSPHRRRLLGVGASAAGLPAPRGSDSLIDPLSRRESEVLTLLAGELSGPQIAGRLFITLNTFRTHTKSIFTKLGVTNRRSAVGRAHQLGLLPSEGPQQ